MKIINYSDFMNFFHNEVKPKKDIADDKVRDIVKEIIEDVRLNGDEAVTRLCKKFDGQSDGVNIVVQEKEIQLAYEAISPVFKEAILSAMDNIRNYHRLQQQQDYHTLTDNGSVLGSIVRPLNKVGIYVPGGKAAYPSTVMMNAIPAQIAGVKEIYLFTPPSKDGRINPYVAATAYMLGITHIYRIGGAQAIAAAAFGTETVQKVDKIVGPGNAYVAEAKRVVYGNIDIDMIAGPSEIMIIADEQANAAWIASDLLSQAEHDEMARCFLVTDSLLLVEKVQVELAQQIEKLKKKAIAAQALEKQSYIILMDSLENAAIAANIVAPEHLEINIKEPYRLLSLIQNAGAIFIGKYSAEAIGDYIAGPNHVLPTGGTAAFSSPLSVADFQKRSSLIVYSKADFKKYAPQAIVIAQAEGLDAHANALQIRLSQDMAVQYD